MRARNGRTPRCTIKATTARASGHWNRSSRVFTLWLSNVRFSMESICRTMAEGSAAALVTRR